VTNNHNLGKAVANALELELMLTVQVPGMPLDLVVHYPELNTFATSKSADQTSGF
jgi:hypothetical protein